MCLEWDKEMIVGPMMYNLRDGIVQNLAEENWAKAVCDKLMMVRIRMGSG